MADVFQRPGSPFWYAWLRDPRAPDGIIRRSTKSRVKSQARVMAREMQAALDGELSSLPAAGALGAPGPILWWSDAAAFFLENAELKKNTRNGHRSQVEVIKSSGLGEFNLASLNVNALDMFVHERRWKKVQRYRAGPSENRVSEATIRRNLSLLSAVITFSIDSKLPGAPSHNVVKLFDRSKLRESPKRKRNLRHDQLMAVLEACDNDEQRRIITVLVLTGIRSGELIALRWGHVDFKRERLEFGNLDPLMTKTSEPRIVPLVTEAVGALTAQFTAQKTQPQMDDHVFPSPRSSRAGKGRANLSGLLRTIKRKTGIDAYTNHALRHTFASMTLQAGADPIALRDVLGHTTLSMSARYANQVTDRVDAMIKGLDYRPLSRPIQRSDGG